MLDRVPVEHFFWKPNTKSNSLEQLAKHIANLPNLIVAVIKLDERDFLNTGVPPLPIFETISVSNKNAYVLPPQYFGNFNTPTTIAYCAAK